MITYKQFLNENESSIEMGLYSKLKAACEDNEMDAREDERGGAAIDNDNEYDRRNRGVVKQIGDELKQRYSYRNITELIEVCIRELDRVEWENLNLTPEEELLLIKYKPEGIVRFDKPSTMTQEYIFTHRPDLSGKIKNVDPNLRKRFSHELNLDKVEV